MSPLKVCFPGGGIEQGESQQSAVVREMKEELGITVKPLRCIWRWDSPSTELTLWGWTADRDNEPIQPDPNEVAEAMWLTGDEAIHHPDAMPTNRSFVLALLNAPC
jgi:8-oxo-dGTP diphosphatase